MKDFLKNRKVVWILSGLPSLLAVFLFYSFSIHKFYVSKTTIQYSARTGVYEVTCKLFTDDLEKAIGGSDEHPVHLGGEREIPDADQRIANYLTDHLKLSFDQQDISLRFVGREVENDLTYCYLEFYREQDFATLKVKNTVFQELFPEQQNIIDFVTSAKTQTVICIRSEPEHVLFR